MGAVDDPVPRLRRTLPMLELRTHKLPACLAQITTQIIHIPLTAFGWCGGPIRSAARSHFALVLYIPLACRCCDKEETAFTSDLQFPVPTMHGAVFAVCGALLSSMLLSIAEQSMHSVLQLYMHANMEGCYHLCMLFTCLHQGRGDNCAHLTVSTRAFRAACCHHDTTCSMVHGISRYTCE